MSMVKIDGSKIKHLREAQGLTQLYLATAVHVTTDTISRWENRRYPSIKRDNALKLSDALNVSLNEILESEHSEAREAAPEPTKIIQSDRNIFELNRSRATKTWLLAFLSVTVILTISLSLWYFSTGDSPDITIVAERTIPTHCISGQPFPVIIKVTGAPEDKLTAIIIKESLPTNAIIRNLSPEAAVGSMKKDMIKWLKKINEPTIFAYVVSISGEENEKATFHGTAAVSSDSKEPPAVVGDDSTTISHFHWADSNKDNIINDSEMLLVQDQYSAIEGIAFNIELIEKIWQGAGYRWNADTTTFEILE